MPAIVVNLEQDRIFRAHEIGAQIPVIYNSSDGTYHLMQGAEGRLKIANYVWDPASLSWIPQVSAADGVTTVAPQALQLELDQANSTTLYLGKAAPGSSTASAVWQIQRFVFSGAGNSNVSKKYAGGTPSFSHVWNNRASLSY